jgi:hypothetical protein
MLDPADAKTTAHAAISDLIQQVDPGAMVTRYVCVVEIIDSDSVRAVWSFAPEDQKSWDTLGLVEYVRTLEYASAVEDR